MTTRQLECFLASSKSLSFNKAAQELFLTQPTVVYQINQLEREVGFPLFYRDTRGLSLTESGAVFQAGAEKILRLMKSEIRKAEKVYKKKNESISILNYNYIHDPLFSKALSDYLLLHPAENIVVRYPSLSENFMNAFQDSDLCILPELSEQTTFLSEMYFEELYQVVTFGILREKHPLSAKKYITMEDAHNYPVMIFNEASMHVMDAMNLWYWKQIKLGEKAYNIEYCDVKSFEEAQINMVKQEGILLSRGNYVNLIPGLIQLPFSDGEIMKNYIVRRIDEQNPKVLAFMEFLIDYYREHWVVEGLEALEKRI